MLKWIKRMFMGLLALIGVALVIGVAFEKSSRWSVEHDYQPDGQLIEVNGSAMHLHCSGAGKPTVLLESGLGFYGSLSWVLVQPVISSTNRVCSYDRAGILWSQGRDEAPTANLAAERLHKLLGDASEEAPYVLVAHSLGGPLSMVFTSLYRQEIAGVVLVDSSHPEQIKRFSADAVAASGGPPPPLVANTMAATGLLRLLASGPMDGVPNEAQVAQQYLPQSMAGILAEFAAIDTILDEANEAASFGDLPLVVLSRGKQFDELPPDLAAEISQVWSELQIELAAFSTRGERRVIDDSGHYIQFDNPDAVIGAIRDVLVSIEKSAITNQE